MKRKHDKKGMVMIGVGMVLLLGVLFLVSCGEALEENYLEPAKLSKDAEGLVSIMGLPKEWIFQYRVADETRITLRADYYEGGKQTISYAPAFSGNIEGEGLLVLDYEDGEFFLGVADDGGHQSIQTTLGDPESMGSLKHSFEERITLESGTYPLAAVVMSRDGSIQSQGIADQEAIDFSIKNNDYMVVFTLEVHP